MLYSIIQYVRIRMSKRTIMLIKKPNKILICSNEISINLTMSQDYLNLQKSFLTKHPKEKTKEFRKVICMFLILIHKSLLSQFLQKYWKNVNKQLCHELKLF